MALNSTTTEVEAEVFAPPASGDMIVVEDLWRTYDMGSEQQVHALRGVSLRIKQNEYVAIMCLGCTKYEVSATLVGRLDGAVAGLTRDKTGKIVGISGFGNLNAYSARLVLQSVSEVTPQEIDYSKVASIIKADPTLDSGGSKPVAEAHKAATAFGPGNPLGNQIERAANAFGKEGDNNGVEIAFGGVNEASARSEQKGERNSPDGVLFNCIFDSSRLKGDALSRAIVHMGQHVADLRSPAAGAENAHLYELEFQAWGTTTFSAIGGRQKTFTLPGGYLVWNADWPKESMCAVTKKRAPQQRRSICACSITSIAFN